MGLIRPVAVVVVGLVACEESHSPGAPAAASIGIPVAPRGALGAYSEQRPPHAAKAPSAPRVADGGLPVVSPPGDAGGIAL